jgi:hypothetical protein
MHSEEEDLNSLTKARAEGLSPAILKLFFEKYNKVLTENNLLNDGQKKMTFMITQRRTLSR